MNVPDLALVNYGERPTCWRSRLLLSHIGHDQWVITAPDHDVYQEQMSLLNSDFTDFRFLGGGGGDSTRHRSSYGIWLPAD